MEEQRRDDYSKPARSRFETSALYTRGIYKGIGHEEMPRFYACVRRSPTALSYP